MAKEAESVEQYDELKEVIYKNKNKKKMRRSRWPSRVWM